VHASRKHDRRLSAALLAAALAHSPEAEEVLRGARNRMARKPSALARELVRNFPKGKRGRGRKPRNGRSDAARRAAAKTPNGSPDEVAQDELTKLDVQPTGSNGGAAKKRRRRAVKKPEAA
jgi:hypothetical protein